MGINSHLLDLLKWQMKHSDFTVFRAKARTVPFAVCVIALPARRNASTLTSRKTPSSHGACPIPQTGTITGQDSTAGWPGMASSLPPSLTLSPWANRVACFTLSNLELFLFASVRARKDFQMTSISTELSLTSIDR